MDSVPEKNMHTVGFTAPRRSTQTPAGDTVMQAARAAGLALSADCGGRGACGKCRVLLSGHVPPPDEQELKYIPPADLDRGVRLACRAVVRGDVSVEILCPVVDDADFALEPSYEPASEQEHPAPALERVPLDLPQPSLQDARSDLRRILDALPQDTRSGLPLSALANLAPFVRENDFVQDAFLHETELVGLCSRGEPAAAAALDVGTTTLCARLVDPATGRVLAQAGAMNPQRLIAADVAGRIHFAATEKNGLRRLTELVRERCNRLLATLAEQAGDVQIRLVSLAGNPTMVHLFLGVSPQNIGAAPYVPAVTRGLCLPAEQAGLCAAASGAPLVVLPSVAAYVGADAVAALLRANLHMPGPPRLLIDMGTNAEIMLSSDGVIHACAAAAGPALEGAHITHGMAAASGAIHSVEIGTDVAVSTIGDAAPRGICGSGLIQALAQLLNCGILTPAGRLLPPEHDSPAPAVLQRLAPREKVYDFILHGADSDNPICLTQGDVRELQLAKGAIRAGQEILLKHAGLGADHIHTVYLAGAFGTHIDPQSALDIGLVPPVPPDRLRFIGNAALDGAADVLLDRELLSTARSTAASVRYLELSSRAEFTDAFMNFMGFPAPD